MALHRSEKGFRNFDQLKTSKARPWRLVVVVIIVYACFSYIPVTAWPNLHNDLYRADSPSTAVVLNEPLKYYAYLPIIAGGYPARVYWGALVGGQAPSMENMQPGGIFDVFETNAKKKMSILHWGQAWMMNNSYQNFYRPWFDLVRSHGSIPMLDWGSWRLGGGSNQPDFKLSAITMGEHDNYIQQWALSAKAWGHPFFLRFDWEMNGN